MLIDGVVPGEVPLAKEAGSSSWFSMVVCRESVRGVVRNV